MLMNVVRFVDYKNIFIKKQTLIKDILNPVISVFLFLENYSCSKQER